MKKKFKYVPERGVLQQVGGLNFYNVKEAPKEWEGRDDLELDKHFKVCTKFLAYVEDEGPITTEYARPVTQQELLEKIAFMEFDIEIYKLNEEGAKNYFEQMQDESKALLVENLQLKAEIQRLKNGKA